MTSGCDSAHWITPLIARKAEASTPPTAARYVGAAEFGASARIRAHTAAVNTASGMADTSWKYPTWPTIVACSA